MKKQITAAFTLTVYLLASILSSGIFIVSAQDFSGVRVSFDGEIKNEGDTENFLVTQTGGVSYITDRTGKQSSAVRFTDGGGINIKSSQGEVNYTGDFSVAMWVNPAYIEADTPIIGNMDWYQDGSWAQQGWQLYFDTTTKGIVFYAVGMDENGNSTKNGCVRNLGALPYHEWTHIAVVFNSAEKQAYYYRNGELASILNIGAEVWNFNCPINQTGETKLGNNGSKEVYKKSDVAYDEFILEQRAMGAEEISVLGKLATPEPQMAFSFEDVIRDEVSNKDYIPVNGKEEEPSVSYIENGVDSKAVMLGNADHIDLGEMDWNDSFTVSMWINPQKSETDSPIMGNLNWENVPEGGWILAFAGNSLPTSLRFTAKQDNTGRVDMRSTAEIPQGQWTHIAVSCDREAGIAKLYVNGVLNQQLASDGLKGGSLQTAYHTRIGQDGTGIYRTEKPSQIGYDNIKIFHSVLNENQIRETASQKGVQAFAQGQFHFDGQYENSVSGGFSINPWNGFDEKQPEFAYVEGKVDKAVRFSEGNHFDVSDMDYENSFSISAWIKASENPTDCPIIGNMNWNNVGAGGWLLAFPGGGLPKNLKFVVKQENTARVDIKTTAEIPKDIWTHVAVCYDRVNGRVKMYINGVLDQDVTDEKLKGGSLESGLATRLGQDGTAVYAPNARMDLSMDELNVYKTVLNDAEIENIVMEDSQPRFDFCWVAGEQATADSYYTANLHVLTPEDYSRYSKVEFDVNFDPEKMRFDHSAMHNFGFSVDTSDQEQGILHCKITPERSLATNTVREYSDSRAAKLTFSVKAEAQGNAVLEIPEYSIKLKNKSAADVTAQTEIHTDAFSINILQPQEKDKNKDGVVGIGDVAMASDQEEAEEIAAQAQIYPYKRVMMVVLDGGGVAFSPNAYHYTKDGEELGRFGVDGYADIRNNPYTIDLINNRCATTFTMQTVHPSWSAPNYTAFLHGFRVYGNSAINPFFCGNEEASSRYFYQYDAEADLGKPSIFRVLKEAMPERTLYSTVQWESITSGIIEPNLGIGTQSASTDRLVTDNLIAYINSSKMKNTVLTFVQWDDVDHAGHGQGFFTDAYYEEVARHDEMYKDIIDALNTSGYDEDTLVIFTADHGGYETGHGAASMYQEHNVFCYGTDGGARQEAK